MIYKMQLVRVALTRFNYSSTIPSLPVISEIGNMYIYIYYTIHWTKPFDGFMVDAVDAYITSMGVRS